MSVRLSLEFQENRDNNLGSYGQVDSDTHPRDTRKCPFILIGID